MGKVLGLTVHAEEASEPVKVVGARSCPHFLYKSNKVFTGSGVRDIKSNNSWNQIIPFLCRLEVAGDCKSSRKRTGPETSMFLCKKPGLV